MPEVAFVELPPMKLGAEACQYRVRRPGGEYGRQKNQARGEVGSE